MIISDADGVLKVCLLYGIQTVTHFTKVGAKSFILLSRVTLSTLCTSVIMPKVIYLQMDVPHIS